MYYGKNKQIKNIFKKGLKQKNRIIRNRRERSYDDSIKRFSRDSEVSKQWYSPTSKSQSRSFTKINESMDDFDSELDLIIRELEEG